MSASENRRVSFHQVVVIYVIPAGHDTSRSAFSRFGVLLLLQARELEQERRKVAELQQSLQRVETTLEELKSATRESLQLITERW